MAVRIEVATIVDDTRAHVRHKKLSHLLFSKKITDIFLLDVITIDKEFSQKELQTIGSAFSNPVTQEFVVKSQESLHSGGQARVKNQENGVGKFSYAIEIGFLPGVTDNVSHTAIETIEDLLKVTFAKEEGVYSSQVTFVVGNITKEEAQEIADSLYNPLIQRASIKSYEEFKKDNGMDMIIPKVALQGSGEVTEVDVDILDEQLAEIGKYGIKNPDGSCRGPLALDLLFMKTIKEYFKKQKRNPTDIELESIAQTWSEHCKHTIFADPIDDVQEGLFKRYIKRATEEIRKTKMSGPADAKAMAGKRDFCISVFTDNSGGIAFDDEWMITHKAETHNSPSALDPFGGAITGIVGVNRDTLGFGLGAKPVANYYGFCFADPRIDIPLYKGPNFTQKMLSSRRIMDGVIDGVNAGGNQSGIPTPQGFVYFDERFRGKPLVFVGTVGLIPRKIKGKLSHIKKANPGDYIVMVGGRVGKDGIHGATFSSEAMDSASPATAVQIGDPITQKKMSDALTKEARDMLLYTSITDNGAGGLSCSVAEMAKESGGCVVDLEKVPLKYPGLAPWEIWISESQERMTLAIPKEKWKLFEDLMQRRGVEATVIGEFTNSKKCIVKNNGKIIMDIDMEFLHNGLPKRPMHSKMPVILSAVKNLPKEDPSVMPQDDNLTKTLLDMMSRLNIASYAFISSQYDHVVQAELVLPPLQGRGRVNSETSVFRPVLSSQKGVILSQGLYPSYSDIDTYAMAAASLDTAVRNIVAAGGNPDYLAILDNFCWTDSNNPEKLGQLKRAAEAIYTYAVAYGTPFISGKDSMFNDFKGYDEKGNKVTISIPPTLLISSIGVVDDITKVVSLDAKIPGDLVYILGETLDELGGSEYTSSVIARSEATWQSRIPYVDAKKNKKLYDSFYAAIQKELIASSISVTRGGLGVALSKKAIGGMLGLQISLKNLSGNFSSETAALFSESQGRILVTVAPENKEKFEKTLAGNTIACIGKVTKEEKIVVQGLKGQEIINISIANLNSAYTRTFDNF